MHTMHSIAPHSLSQRMSSLGCVSLISDLAENRMTVLWLEADKEAVIGL